MKPYQYDSLRRSEGNYPTANFLTVKLMLGGELGKALAIDDLFAVVKYTALRDTLHFLGPDSLKHIERCYLTLLEVACIH